ncbi:ABC transporter substrate-binding protein, partial [Schumannella luteola]
DADAAAALPEAPADVVVPTEAQSTSAGTLLGEKWAAAVQ